VDGARAQTEERIVTALANDLSFYRFFMGRQNPDHGHKWEITDHYFDLPRVSTIKSDTLGIPPGAMAWHGFRIGIAGLSGLLSSAAAADLLDKDPVALEELLRESGCDPNQALASTADRGTRAHDTLEHLSAGDREWAEKEAEREEKEEGTLYSRAVIACWDEEYAPHIESGAIDKVLSEVPVWSLKLGYAGRFDLAVHWADTDSGPAGWSIDDLKTHKPANGFTKPGRGPAHLSDVVQLRMYRIAFEEMGLGNTIGNSTLIARGEGARTAGKYLTDDREVSEEFVQLLVEMREHKLAFEGSD
jgi:hypothetical protein